MPQAVRSVDKDTLGSGVRARELVTVNAWWIVIGRAVWWVGTHPFVGVPVAGSIALGVATRSVIMVAVGAVAGAVLAVGTWVGVACVRGSARGVGPILSGLSRIVTVRRRWPGVSRAVGYDQAVEDWPSHPPLRGVRMTQHGIEATAVTGWVVRHGSALEKSAPDIAAGMFCDRVRVRTVDPSHTHLTFEWGKHLSREYRLHDLPPAETASWPTPIVFGITEDGGPAELVPNLSTLVGGASGSGKSSAAWSILAAYLRAEIPIRVRVVDPGELEFSALKEALDAHNDDPTTPNICHEYVTDFDQVKEFWGHLDRGLEGRKAAMRGTGIREHVPIPEEPIDVTIVDELLPYVDDLRKAGVNHPLGKTAYLGRKYGYVVIACTQAGQIDTIGRVRDLFPQRVCFRTKSRHLTEAVLGDGAESEGARCSAIDMADRGVCYLEVPGHRGYLAGRSAYVPDEELRYIAAGQVPPVPTPEAVLTERRNRKPTGLYRHYARTGYGIVELYVGISNDVDARWEQHEADKPWWPWVDLELSEVETLPNRELAETAELLAIAQERPLFNTVGNSDNPYRVDWRVMPSDTDWGKVIEAKAQRMQQDGWKLRGAA